uniref:CpG DNA-induced protein n=1 Tax=Macrobrachium rosenbergii TaxID=79674 RepID=B5TRE0_MACRS|nr:CpG DNA-induced protein [Macrobrachium rosenbergii]
MSTPASTSSPTTPNEKRRSSRIKSKLQFGATMHRDIKGDDEADRPQIKIFDMKYFSILVTRCTPLFGNLVPKTPFRTDCKRTKPICLSNLGPFDKTLTDNGSMSCLGLPTGCFLLPLCGDLPAWRGGWAMDLFFPRHGPEGRIPSCLLVLCEQMRGHYLLYLSVWGLCYSMSNVQKSPTLPFLLVVYSYSITLLSFLYCLLLWCPAIKGIGYTTYGVRPEVGCLFFPATKFYLPPPGGPNPDGKQRACGLFPAQATISQPADGKQLILRRPYTETKKNWGIPSFRNPTCLLAFPPTQPPSKKNIEATKGFRLISCHTSVFPESLACRPLTYVIKKPDHSQVVCNLVQPTQHQDVPLCHPQNPVIEGFNQTSCRLQRHIFLTAWWTWCADKFQKLKEDYCCNRVQGLSS